MRPPRGTAALAMVFGSVTLTTCVFPTERDDSVRVTVDPLPVLIRGTDTYATARAWRIVAGGDSQPIANVSFVWSSGDPLTATVDANGHVVGIKSGRTAIRAAAANFDNGVFGFSRDTVRVIRRDLYEPNETSPTRIDLETSRPFPGTILNVLLFLNPALSFEPLLRDVKQGADWYHLRQATTRDLTVVVNSDVPGTFQTFLTDSLGYRSSDTTYFLGRNAWTFGPQSHSCHGAAFGPKEAPAESTVVAFHNFADTALDAIAVYTREGRYALTVVEGYALTDKRLQRDAHEEDNFCDAADAKPILLGNLPNGTYQDTLAIENAQ